jgi:outer membrane lipoprotein SlyB
MVKSISILSALVLATGSLLASTPASARHYESRYEACDNCGTVRSVERISHRSRHYGGGTLVGALVGGALGNQIGKGDGRKAATIGGAVVGGAVGHNIEKRHRGSYSIYRISVRTDDGRIETYDQDRSYGLRPGDRVALEDEVRPLY